MASSTKPAVFATLGSRSRRSCQLLDTTTRPHKRTFKKHQHTDSDVRYKKISLYTVTQKTAVLRDLRTKNSTQIRKDHLLYYMYITTI